MQVKVAMRMLLRSSFRPGEKHEGACLQGI